MLVAPPPTNEADRLAALHAYDILDTDPEEAFDDLVSVAARICDTPIALVSLIDEHRQWFKARVGLEATETPRDVAFCSHALLDPGEVLVVADAKADPRFADNPLVTGDPRVTFYAGAPLVTPDGLPMGTLCVIDHEPRELSDEELDTLQRLARATVNQLELRKAALDLRELSRRLERSNRKLERRNSEIRRFYQHLSHELKTPLTVTRDYVSMVLEGLAGETTDEQRQFLSIGLQGCDQMAAHMHDLLDLTRLETGKLSIAPVRISTATLLESAVFALKPSADRSRVGLRFTPSAELPDILGDPGRITQVISNLVSNAIKFTSEGGEIDVAAGASPARAGFIEVTVRDTGRGISEEDQEHIFDRLFQCDAEDSASRKGLGLGLHLCREIVRMHGGEISVDSTVGVGTTFRFLLPVHEEHAVARGVGRRARAKVTT